MARWTIRDLRGHFAKKRDRGKLCPHACCKGKRPHPETAELIPSRIAVRGLTDAQLAAAVDWEDPKSVKKFMAEAERRDRAERTKANRQTERQRLEDDRFLAVHAAYLRAEHETRGHMLSKAGYAAKIDPVDLFSGTRARARKYGSEELNNWFDEHGRPTVSAMRAQMARERQEAEDYDQRRAGSYPGIYPA